jgi:hypothetical protein
MDFFGFFAQMAVFGHPQKKKREKPLVVSQHMVPGGEGGFVRDEFWGVGGAIAHRG